MGNRTTSGTGRMTVDHRQKNERSRTGNPYSSHVKAGKHACTVYNFKRKSRIRKPLTRLRVLPEFIHKYNFLNFVSFYNGLNSNAEKSAPEGETVKDCNLLSRWCKIKKSVLCTQKHKFGEGNDAKSETKKNAACICSHRDGACYWTSGAYRTSGTQREG